MQPIERLTAEHRLIQRMLKVMADELKQMNSACCVRTDFVDAAVNFLQTYADLTHHGKEEAILFKALEDKPISDELRETMEKLKLQHQHVRERTTLLVAARDLCHRGSGDACTKVTQVLNELLAFYPAHTEKEEQHFFAPSMDYFTEEERLAMVAQMDSFDQNVIHEKYSRLVDHLECDR
jgi:hemerythrin-like domain-containing protein